MTNTLKDSLFLITARGGSKGIPGKNIKKLDGKPLLCYTVDVARALVPDEQICLSTDDDDIISVAENIGLPVLFKRPADLALDNSGSYGVILHALNFYKALNKNFKNLILLQPTSPFRTPEDVKKAIDLFNYEIDMVVSVNVCRKNPYYNLFEENDKGFIIKSQKEKYNRRQDAPSYYVYNGAIYVINVKSLFNSDLEQFKKVKKYVMDPLNSVDIDTIEDWEWAEYLKKN